MFSDDDVVMPCIITFWSTSKGRFIANLDSTLSISFFVNVDCRTPGSSYHTSSSTRPCCSHTCCQIPSPQTSVRDCECFWVFLMFFFFGFFSFNYLYGLFHTYLLLVVKKLWVLWFCYRCVVFFFFGGFFGILLCLSSCSAVIMCFIVCFFFTFI